MIVDADGKQLVTSDGPEGNIGCPVSAAERGHFIDMVKRTRTRITDEELATLEKELAAFGEEIESARR